MTDIRSDIEKEAQSALIQYAFFRWENAVLLGLSLILASFQWLGIFSVPFLPAWGWLVLGGVGVAAMTVSSLTDAETNAKVLRALFQERFNPRDIHNPGLRQEVERALEYQERIESHIGKQEAGVLRDRLNNTANQLADWIANIYQLAMRLDAYRRDPLLPQERETAPEELETLRSRVEYEKDPDVRQQLSELIERKHQQLESMQALDARMKQAELRLEESLTSLATVYNQMQLISAQDVDSGRSERLRQDINEQVSRLDDLVTSLNEVYDYDGLEL
ncbi:MAG: hypothetical protein GVY30_04285 [Chloroflexi bacterium]|jgi:chromosome segregation ATPase|nr:hypothetical protein [Chloroflexota bacterium]